jgi:hypothetical protein
MEIKTPVVVIGKTIAEYSAVFRKVSPSFSYLLLLITPLLMLMFHYPFRLRLHKTQNYEEFQ